MNWIIKQTKTKRIEFDYDNMEVLLIVNDNVEEIVVVEYPATALNIKTIAASLWTL